MTTTYSKPYTVTINENSAVAFPQAAALIRMGYVFTEMPPTIHAASGEASITLVLGTPDDNAIKGAEASMNLMSDFIEAARQREIEAAAKQMMAAIERDNDKKALDAQIDAQTKALRKLKDQAAKL